MDKETQGGPLLDENEKARKVLEALNVSLLDTEEQLSVTQIQASYALFEACFTWLKLHRFPFIYEDESGLYQAGTPNEQGH